MSTPMTERTLATLRRYTSDITARGIVARATAGRTDSDVASLGFAEMVMHAARVFVAEPERTRLIGELRGVFGAEAGPQAMRVEVQDEGSARRARLLARRVALEAGASSLVALHAATAVSELARNMLMYASGGSVELLVITGPTRLRVVASDTGPGIPNLEEVLSGTYRSRTGLGRGLRGTRQLADRFDVQTGPEGTRVELEVNL